MTASESGANRSANNKGGGGDEQDRPIAVEGRQGGEAERREQRVERAGEAEARHPVRGADKHRQEHDAHEERRRDDGADLGLREAPRRKPDGEEGKIDPGGEEYRGRESRRADGETLSLRHR